MKMEDPTKVQQKEISPIRNEQTFSVSFASNGQLGYQKTVELRPLKVRDYKMLTSGNANDINYMIKLVEVVQACIYPLNSLDVKELTMADFTKLIIALKINSTSSTYELIIPCMRCTGDTNKNKTVTFNYIVDLDKLEEKLLDTNFKEPYLIKEGLNIKLPRVKHYLTENVDELAVAYDGDINELKLGDYIEIQKTLEKFDYGYITDLKVVHQDCQEVIELTLPFRADFFVS